MGLFYFARHPRAFFAALLYRFGTVFSDRFYLQLLYRIKVGRRLNLDSPKTFTEKIQWLKLYNRSDLYTRLVDKVEVKEYVSEKIGKEYIIPTIGVWDKPEDIDWSSLPNRFVLKTTHGGGNYGVIVCKDKDSFNTELACKYLNQSYKQDLYKALREWPYKNVKKRVLAEQYLEDESGYELKDYKVFCFNGEPRMIDVDYNRSTNHQRNLYTPEWERINATLGYPSDNSKFIPKPVVLDQLLDLARQLSDGFYHVRTDFYIVGTRIYFGELTFYHGSGFEKAYPESFDSLMGRWLTLPTDK